MGTSAVVVMVSSLVGNIGRVGGQSIRATSPTDEAGAGRGGESQYDVSVGSG